MDRRPVEAPDNNDKNISGFDIGKNSKTKKETASTNQNTEQQNTEDEKNQTIPLDTGDTETQKTIFDAKTLASLGISDPEKVKAYLSNASKVELANLNITQSTQTLQKANSYAASLYKLLATLNPNVKIPDHILPEVNPELAKAKYQALAKDPALLDKPQELDATNMTVAGIVASVVGNAFSSMATSGEANTNVNTASEGLFTVAKKYEEVERFNKTLDFKIASKNADIVTKYNANIGNTIKELDKNYTALEKQRMIEISKIIQKQMDIYKDRFKSLVKGVTDANSNATGLAGDIAKAEASVTKARQGALTEQAKLETGVSISNAKQMQERDKANAKNSLKASEIKQERAKIIMSGINTYNAMTLAQQKDLIKIDQKQKEELAGASAFFGFDTATTDLMLAQTKDLTNRDISNYGTASSIYAKEIMNSALGYKKGFFRSLFSDKYEYTGKYINDVVGLLSAGYRINMSYQPSEDDLDKAKTITTALRHLVLPKGYENIIKDMPDQSASIGAYMNSLGKVQKAIELAKNNGDSNSVAELEKYKETLGNALINAGYLRMVDGNSKKATATTIYFLMDYMKDYLSKENGNDKEK